jgi:spore maturation protein CgeB
MNQLSILYIGSDSGTSRHRALALQRLGNRIHVIDPRKFVLNHWLVHAWIWKTGSLLLEDFVRWRVLESIPAIKFDLVYVDGGELVGPSLLRDLKKKFGTVINYNLDDPYGKRDANRWRLYLQAVPLYDLVVVVRGVNVAEADAAGARDVFRVRMSADEVAHSPRQISPAEAQRWATEIVFIGTWMPERGPFMARLIELGLPLTIYGNGWHKAREWPILKAYRRGVGLDSDDDYARAVQCAKVNLGLLSKGNRDLSTTRSFEIPHLGGMLCAERTPEHAALYREGAEAVFWSTPEECAQKCRQLLDDTEWRCGMAMRGRKRCLANRTTNEYVLNDILCRALGMEQQVPTRNSELKRGDESAEDLDSSCSYVNRAQGGLPGVAPTG